MALVMFRSICNSALPRLSASCRRIEPLALSNTKIPKISGSVAIVSSKSFTNSTILNSRRYSEKHEWVEVEGSIGTIGITDYAQEALGDIVYAQLPEVGTQYSQNDECGALESVKAASELYTPVSGKVTEVNKELEDQPSLINQSCYKQGWLFKVELNIPNEVSELMDESTYEKFLKEQ